MRALVLGDSMIKRIQPILPSCLDGVELVSRGVPGIGIEGIAWKLNSKKFDLNGHFDMVFVHVGTNDLAHRSTSHLSRMYRYLLESITKRFPGTLILISAILPRLEGKYNTFDECLHLNCKTRDVNDMVQALCSSASQVYFFRRPDTYWWRKISWDGLHLKRECNRCLSELIVEAIQSVIPVKRPQEPIPVWTLPLEDSPRADKNIDTKVWDPITFVKPTYASVLMHTSKTYYPPGKPLSRVFNLSKTVATTISEPPAKSLISVQACNGAQKKSEWKLVSYKKARKQCTPSRNYSLTQGMVKINS